MVMSFGSAGAPNLNNVRNVQRWKVVLTLALLPKNLPIIFRKDTLAIITVKPIT